MIFNEMNLNPEEHKTGDCVVRAIMKAERKTWRSVYDDLCALGRENFKMPNNKEIYSLYLKSLGWTKLPMPKKPNNKRYTVGQYSVEHPTGKFLIGINKHLTYLENNILTDTWDCREYSILNVWTKK